MTVSKACESKRYDGEGGGSLKKVKHEVGVNCQHDEYVDIRAKTGGI